MGRQQLPVYTGHSIMRSTQATIETVHLDNSLATDVEQVL